MAPKAPKHRRDALGPEGPPVRVPRAANRRGGRGPGAPDPVPDPDPMADWARPDSPDGADGEDVGQSSRQRIRRSPSPPPPAARPAMERRQLRRRPAEAPSRPPLVAAVEEEEDEPKRKVCKDALPEGDYLVKWTAVEDKVQYIRWGAISTEDLRDVMMLPVLDV
ncbi:hypothetical protein R1sor_019869 [Riccia sorocarpa]|uniref:Uncharacterized protein n=1 Tax=Riccia sorocarpa TaxID=122646 RepID=A0ABD3II41_9MARC